MKYTLKNEFYTVTLSDLGAEIVSIKSKDGFEFMWSGMKGKNYWSMSAPILFPVCGSLPSSRYTLSGKEYEMPQHGFALSSVFELLSKSDTHIEFLLKSSEESKKRYPFDFNFKLKYTLLGEKLVFNTSVENLSGETMPYMFGWHPGFNLPTDEKCDIESFKLALGRESVSWIPLTDGVFYTEKPVLRELPNGEYGFNEKEIYENDTMIFKGHDKSFSLYANESSYRLNMTASENLPTLCIWKEPDSKAKFICIEPWSEWGFDDKNNGNFDVRKMPRLAPGGKDEYEITLELKI